MKKIQYTAPELYIVQVNTRGTMLTGSLNANGINLPFGGETPAGGMTSDVKVLDVLNADWGDFE